MKIMGFISYKRVFFFNRKMIFEQSFYNNFFDNFLSYTHIIFLFSFSVTLDFMLIHFFFVKIWLSIWLSNK